MPFPRLLTLFIVGGLLPLALGEESSLTFEGIRFQTYTLDPKEESLQLVWKKPDGTPYDNLQRVHRAMTAKGKKLRFITNAGIYEKAPGINQGYQPEGLHVEEGKELIPLNRKLGKGNFYLQPNGVFFINDKDNASVKTTKNYIKGKHKPKLACQSGPILVSEGELHPAFNANGTSKRLRNGVGVREDGTIVFAICASGEVVNFHTFARLFKDGLKCPNALFLDGDLCKMAVDPADTLAPHGTFAAMFILTD